MADWNDILNNSEEPLKDDELINYVEDNLSEEEKHDFEKKLVDSSFMNDAVEGLHHFNTKQQLNQYVLQINKNLQSQLDAKKQRRKKRRLKDNPWTVISILILLAICIIGYFVIHFHLKEKLLKTPAKTEATLNGG